LESAAPDPEKVAVTLTMPDQEEVMGVLVFTAIVGSQGIGQLLATVNVTGSLIKEYGASGETPWS
jgi:hypothetical protein